MRKHLVAILGGILTLGSWTLWLIDQASRAEWVADHAPVLRDFAKVMADYLSAPPAWTVPVLTVVGILLIWLDLRRAPAGGAREMSVADQLRQQELTIEKMREKRLAKEFAAKQAQELTLPATVSPDLHPISIWTEYEDYSQDRVRLRLKNVSDSVLDQCLVKVEGVESPDWLRSHGSASPVSRSLRTTGQQLSAKWDRFKLAPGEWKDIAVGRIDRRNGVLVLEYEGGTAYLGCIPSAAKIELGFYGGRTSGHATLEVALATGGYLIAADGLSVFVKHQLEKPLRL